MSEEINLFILTLNSEDGVHKNTIISYKYDINQFNNFIKKKNNLNFKKRSKELNWNLFKKIKDKRPLILSGALNINNLKQAIKKTNLGFIDVSSSLETMPGKKSIKKIDKFLELATKL